MLPVVRGQVSPVYNSSFLLVQKDLLGILTGAPLIYSYKKCKTRNVRHGIY